MSDAHLWREAAKKEIKSLQDLNVYKLVPWSTVPPGQKVIGTKWVSKVKANQTYKARFVAQGLETGTRTRLRQHFRSSLQTAECADGARDRRRDGLGGSPTGRENLSLIHI